MNKKRLRIAYAAPQTEVCAAEPYKFLAASPGGSGGGLSGGAGDGDEPPEGDIVGAKGFGFDDDESYEQEYGWGDLWDGDLWNDF